MSSAKLSRKGCRTGASVAQRIRRGPSEAEIRGSSPLGCDLFFLSASICQNGFLVLDVVFE